MIVEVVAVVDTPVASTILILALSQIHLLLLLFFGRCFSPRASLKSDLFTSALSSIFTSVLFISNILNKMMSASMT